MRRFSVAYHFDPASRGSEESQNNSFRTSLPLAMKIAAGLSHFSSFCLIPSLFSPRAAVAFRQTKMQRLLLEKELVIGARGSYGLFCQTFLKGHGTFSFPFSPPSFLTRSSETTRISPPLWVWRTFGRGRTRSLVAQTPAVRFPFARRALLHPGDVTRAKGGGALGAFFLCVVVLTLQRAS